MSKHTNNRAERRETTERKWKSKLRKLWECNFFMERINKIKSDKSLKYKDYPKAESWKDFENDRFGVMLKNTGTICKDIKMTTQEEHKRNLQNKIISKEDMEDANNYIEDLNNPYSFEKYCGSCDNFNTEFCKFRDKVFNNTEWKKIKCTDFYD